MPAFCDVALPVPLEQVFSYSIPDGMEVQPGSRVLVAFRNQQLAGIVVRLFDEPPFIDVKPLARVLEHAPLLPAELMELARWIAAYYVAPIGEVLRGMMPLQAEVRRENFFAITEAGMSALQQGAERGSSLRSKLSPEQQRQQYAVLDALSHGEALSAR
jgi:primosomal protein N' (replication factor Y)